MGDLTYPLRVLKHKFAKAAVYHEGKTLITSMILCGTIGFGGVYAALDKSEDNIKSPQAPQAMQRINNELISLTEQKHKILDIKNKIGSLEFNPHAYKLSDLQKQKKQVISLFKTDAENTLDYIITNKHLSEQQISGLWNKIADELIKPENINANKYSNNYDFGFLKEAQVEITSINDNFSISNTALKIDSKLKEEAEIKNLAVLALFLAIMAQAILAPLLGHGGSKNLGKWAKEKPKRRQRLKY